MATVQIRWHSSVYCTVARHHLCNNTKLSQGLVGVSNLLEIDSQACNDWLTRGEELQYSTVGLDFDNTSDTIYVAIKNPVEKSALYVQLPWHLTYFNTHMN